MKEEHDRVMESIKNTLREEQEVLGVGVPSEMDQLAMFIHRMNRAKGFWDMAFIEVPLPDEADKPTAFEFDPHLRNTGEAIALMHSELSEALEAHRKSAPDDKLPHYPGVFVELADCVIRILDYCAAHEVPLYPIILEKLIYNASRPYKHGKAY